MRILSLMAVAFFLAACSTANIVTEQPVESSIGIVDEYKLGIGDAVEVNVWRNPDLSVSVMVRPDGKISVPLAGDVEVDGVSTNELSKIIEERLSSYIRNPKVTDKCRVYSPYPCDRSSCCTALHSLPKRYYCSRCDSGSRGCDAFCQCR